jgi:hypothetical protein
LQAQHHASTADRGRTPVDPTTTVSCPARGRRAQPASVRHRLRRPAASRRCHAGRIRPAGGTPDSPRQQCAGSWVPASPGRWARGGRTGAPQAGTPEAPRPAQLDGLGPLVGGDCREELEQRSRNWSLPLGCSALALGQQYEQAHSAGPRGCWQRRCTPAGGSVSETGRFQAGCGISYQQGRHQRLEDKRAVARETRTRQRTWEGALVRTPDGLDEWRWRWMLLRRPRTERFLLLHPATQPAGFQNIRVYGRDGISDARLMWKLRHECRRGVISKISLSPEMQRQGLGTLLIDRALLDGRTGGRPAASPRMAGRSSGRCRHAPAPSSRQELRHASTFWRAGPDATSPSWTEPPRWAARAAR